MKKIFSALAAAVMAFTAFAFTGCDVTSSTDDDTKNPGIENPDNTADKDAEPDNDHFGAMEDGNLIKSPEKLAEILEGIDTSKLFGDKIGLGVSVELKGETDQGRFVKTKGQFSLDYRISADLATGYLAGIGTASIESSLDIMNGYQSESYNVALDCDLYNDADYAYLMFTEDGENHKGKLDINKIANALNGSNVTPVSSVFALALDDGYGTADGLDLVTVLQMADEFGITVSADTTDGIKFKISASEQTVWSLVTLATGDEMPAELYEVLQYATVFNKFTCDLYFAIDGNGAFVAAETVIDVDVVIDSNRLAEALKIDTVAEKDSYSLSFSCHAKVYAHNNTYTVPEDVLNDDGFEDVTDELIEKLNDRFKGGII